jgi:hypothetical protein
VRIADLEKRPGKSGVRARGEYLYNGIGKKCIQENVEKIRKAWAYLGNAII